MIIGYFGKKKLYRSGRDKNFFLKFLNFFLKDISR